MKLREVKIKNFRCLEDVTIPIDDTTILVGANNAGKTAFLDALRVVLVRSAIGRTNPFDEYDYRLSSGEMSPQTSPGIIIELCFREDKTDEWDESILQDLKEVVQKNITLDINSIRIRVSSKYDTQTSTFVPTWEFLNEAGDPLSPKTGTPRNFGVFFEYCRLFYISALRDAEEQFSAKSGYWGRILKDLKVDEPTRAKLQAELETLNKAILASDPRLERVCDALDSLQTLVAVPGGKTTSIQAVPLRPWDLMSRAEVVIKTQGGAVNIPLAHHGQGVQSLSVLFLFQAYIDIMLKPQYRPYTEAILALEEPEAHLHPQAVRSLASSINKLTSQKLISTHSPFFVQEISLSHVRLFRQSGGKTEVRMLKHGALSGDELQALDLYCKRTRGEILFARAWLLCEGQSEYVLLRYFAELLGSPLDNNGVSIIDFQNNGSPGAFVGLGEAFGIPWLLICDNDQQEAAFRREVLSKGITGTRMAALFNALPGIGIDFERFLYQNGFKDVYLAMLKSGLAPTRDKIIGEGKAGKLIQQPDGIIKVEVPSQAGPPQILLPGSANYETELENVVVKIIQCDKIGNAYKVISAMRAKVPEIAKAMIPQFFVDRINEIIQKAG